MRRCCCRGAGSPTVRTNVVAVVAPKGHVEVRETAHVAATARNVLATGVEGAVGDGVIGSALAQPGSSKIEVLFDTELQRDVVGGSAWRGQHQQVAFGPSR